jgi:lipopolysaccharide/colanic/teichoic acid biosynthesis glycosyltransferase
VTLLRVNRALAANGSPIESAEAVREMLNERSFKNMIAIERKRTERSREPFLMMLVEAGISEGSDVNTDALEAIAGALLSRSRETDLVGWYSERLTVGVIFTGLESSDKNAIVSTILTRVKMVLRDDLNFNQFSQLKISFHFFPDWEHPQDGNPSDPALYPDVMRPGRRKRSLLFLKRTGDIVGSVLALVLFAPVLLAIAVAIKISSRGPVLFRQQRVGQYGKCFTFLKFRSMYVNNDSQVHQKFVTELITRDAEKKPTEENHDGIYKITNDRRITRVGKFLRRTSLDELPQLVNVLKGEMSLVGPRPAIPYELAAYQAWHRRRVLEAKPGITGLWQVAGRSRVRFDDMVRMDLRYATTWTPWLDIKILLLTPMAVLRGTGAY